MQTESRFPPDSPVQLTSRVTAEEAERVGDENARALQRVLDRCPYGLECPCTPEAFVPGPTPSLLSEQAGQQQAADALECQGRQRELRQAAKDAYTVAQQLAQRDGNIDQVTRIGQKLLGLRSPK